MRVGHSWLKLVVALGMVTMLACTQQPAAVTSPDTGVDDILDTLDAVGKQTGLAASTNPTLTITQPVSDYLYFQWDAVSTDIAVTFAVTNWTPWPQDGKLVRCYLDGEEHGYITTGDIYTFTGVPHGEHQLCCSLAQGPDLDFCEATDCVYVRVQRPCTMEGDPICDDGNPCSLDGCIQQGNTTNFVCRYGTPVGQTGCCQSQKDCGCVNAFDGARWETCDDTTSFCVMCKDDAACDDGESCTNDYCSEGLCKNDWIVDGNGAKCCHAGIANVAAVCNDGKFCTVDSCDEGAGWCKNESNGDPICCEADPDVNCDDSNVCTLDRCIAHVCRHGPVSDPLCCNNSTECDDGNPCTDDLCDPDTNQCQFIENNLTNCCNVHPDCSSGGKWDDEDASTLDYCQNFQCVHVTNPTYCDATGTHPCLDDGDACTTDACESNVCKHNYMAGCCNVDKDCNDKKYCTKDTCLCLNGTNPDGSCKCPLDNPDCNATKECSNAPINGCCETNDECIDGNPCNLDACINHVCRYGPNWNLTNCCQNDANCDDGNTCTDAYCDLETKTCITSLVEGQTPKCCFTDSQCDDNDFFTLDVCKDKRCTNLPDPSVCDAAHSECNDNNPCTTDSCDFVLGKCRHVAIANCCKNIYECTVLPLTDSNTCTTDTCNLTTNRCEFAAIANCCTSTANCNDNDPCTADSCMNNTCRHVAPPSCCDADADCDDGNTCTINKCKKNLPADLTGQCQLTVVAEPGCCTTAAGCNDSNICTDDTCVNYKCENADVQGDCCQVDPDCNDDNICTCDKCIFGKCRFLTPDVATTDCNLSPLCCANAAACQDDMNPCTENLCVDSICTYKPTVPCKVALPYYQNFNTCPKFSTLGWQQVDLGAEAIHNWICTAEGDLGIDNHLRFNWVPAVFNPFDNFIVTPGLLAQNAGFVTVQFDQQFDYDETYGVDPVNLGVYVVQDIGAVDNIIQPDDTFIPIYQELDAVADLAAGQKHVIIPPTYLSNSLYIGFNISSSSSQNLGFYDIDNVKICKGRPPAFVNPPAAVGTAWNTEKWFNFKVKDLDDTPLTFTIVEGPGFVSLMPAQYSWFNKEYTLTMVAAATTQDQVGEHKVVIEVNDGCLSARQEITMTVLLTSGFVVWKPTVVPEAAGAALFDAIVAAGENVQLVEDLDLFANLDGISGVFITLGVYGNRFQLNSLPASTLAKLTSYLDKGGNVYMEGGDTWFVDTASAVHPYFHIQGIHDGTAGKFVGNIVGKNFAFGEDFAAANLTSVNNFLDRINPVASSGAVPLLKPASFNTWNFMVGYQDSTKNYRTVGSSIPIAALTEVATGTRNSLVGKIVEFFKNGWPACSNDSQCDDGVACTLDTCENNECKNVAQDVCISCADDRDCPADYACKMSNKICGQILGERFDSKDTPRAIASATAGIYTSKITVPGALNVDNVNVKLYIAHTARGDLKVTLSHGGVAVVLKTNNVTDRVTNLYYTYDYGTTTYVGSTFSMDDFDGMVENGDWTLTVEDMYAGDGGNLLKWSLFVVADVPTCGIDDDCDDGVVCTLDTCNTEQGYCQFEVDTCEDTDADHPNLCTTDTCDDTLGCLHAPKDCDDNSVCTDDSCDTLTGDCINTPVKNCIGACLTHKDCGYDDYCEPVSKVCQPIPGTPYYSPNATDEAIPDNNTAALISKITIPGGGYIDDINVKVMIKHTYSGDLTVILSNGTKTLTLHDQTGGSRDDVWKVFDLADAADGGDLSVFNGQPLAGEWTLEMRDYAAGDVGKLFRWTIFVGTSTCFSDVNCDDKNMCTTDVCDTQVQGGQCVNTPVVCDDGSWCNGTEICRPDAGCIVGVAPIINDKNPCTADVCDEAQQQVFHTPMDSACDDGNFCNGAETCHLVQGCKAGTAPATDDGILCTLDYCDEAGDVIQHVPSNNACSDGLFCNGPEICNPNDPAADVEGCVAGSAPMLDDGIDCTLDACDEIKKVVTHTANHTLCSDSQFCNGIEICDLTQGCIAGNVPAGSDDNVGCTLDACDETQDKWTHTPQDSVCDDGLFCTGAEKCLANTGCVVQNVPVVDDKVNCTVDTCDETNDIVTHLPDVTLCEDGNACTDNICSPTAGCTFMFNTVPCDDGEACTKNDVCAIGRCTSGTPNTDLITCTGCIQDSDCPDDGNACNGKLKCDIASATCVMDPANAVVHCDLHANPCMVNECNPAKGICEAKAKSAGTNCNDYVACTANDRCNGAGVCLGSDSCNDQLFCNGSEACNKQSGECVSSAAPKIDDNNNCTIDYCDEANNAVVHVASHSYCSDGQYCNGEEICDTKNGCHAGTPLSLNDEFECTIDTCNETVDAIVHTPNNVACSDGQFCNGAEICSTLNGCNLGVVPTEDDGIICTDETCDETSDSVKHVPNHEICNDGNVCNGINYCSVMEGCLEGPLPDPDDGIPCTMDTCENGEIVNSPVDSACDDGVFCNGAELCSSTLGCVSSPILAVDDSIDCTVDYCDENADQVVHLTSDVVCDDGAFCNGTEICDLSQGCISNNVPDCADNNPCSADVCNPALNNGIGACDNSGRVQFCEATCGGNHSFDAGDDDCGYDDACVGGLSGQGSGNCTPICASDSCGTARSGALTTRIPDMECLTANLTVDAPNGFVAGVDVKAALVHSRVADLQVRVQDPAGNWVTLWNKGTGGSNANFNNTFVASYSAIPGSMCSFIGKQADGVWKLEICDQSAGNEGVLKGWGIYVDSSAQNLSSGDVCATPINITSEDGDYTYVGELACASNNYNGACGGAGGPDRVYRFTLTGTTTVTASTDSEDLLVYIKSAANCDGASSACGPTLTKQLAAGSYVLVVDSASSAAPDYKLSVSFRELLASGLPCTDDTQCIAGHCANGFCCAAGDCCAANDDCPASYTATSECLDPNSCQGVRTEGTCEDNTCVAKEFPDDSGCNARLAVACGCFADMLCTNAVTQDAPVCPATCNGDSDCDTETCFCNTFSICATKGSNGNACTEGRQCLSGHCNNGICCDSGDCCQVDSECPLSYNKPPECDSPGSCQGHVWNRSCVNYTCTSGIADDDSLCGVTTVADECGPYPAAMCSGLVEQEPPVCANTCVQDTDCDEYSRCDNGICAPFQPNGSPCAANGECQSDHCENGFCCDAGVCCDVAASCPAGFTMLPTCHDPAGCQGSSKAALCIGFTCLESPANDDTPCTTEIKARDCGLYAPVFCTGQLNQGAPAACKTQCLTNADCAATAYCDSTTSKCVVKTPDGARCTGDQMCASGHCSNGFCCASGDCCALDGDCPASYAAEPTCDDPATCQGTKKLKQCSNFICKSKSVPHDGGCTAAMVSKDCGCFPSVYCNGAQEQATPACKTFCAGDPECDLSCHCDGACVPNQTLGIACDEDVDCASGFCVDGVCCNSRCEGLCKTCKGVDTEGTCTYVVNEGDADNECPSCQTCNGSGACAKVAAGKDPVNDCTALSQSTCLLDGACDGNGSCSKWPLGTECQAKKCVNGQKTNPSLCNGSGTCQAGPTVSCGLYNCTAGGDDCLTTCSSDTDCASGNWCDKFNQCVPKKALGDVCSSVLGYSPTADANAQCSSGFCADGVCCSDACQGACKACDTLGNEGICILASPSTDPLQECGICGQCDGVGSCVKTPAGEDDPRQTCDAIKKLATTCSYDGTCNGDGACRLWTWGTVCVNGTGCTAADGGAGDWANGASICNGNGQCIPAGQLACSPYRCNGTDACFDTCNTNAECAPTAICYGNKCIQAKPDGQTCSGETAGYECQSGLCVDGICCATACDGLCEACNVTGKLGICTAIPANTDPANECTTACNACDGNRACGAVTPGTDPTDDCAASLQTSCGLDGTCGAGGVCRSWLDGTVCTAQTCNPITNTLTLASTCDGLGVCDNNGTKSCSPFKCNNLKTNCATICAFDTDCVIGAYCGQDRRCHAKKANDGSTCAEDKECISGICTDGFCCDSECGLTCESCALPGKVGTCTLVAAQEDPDNDCAEPCQACSGIDHTCILAVAGSDPNADCTQSEPGTCGLDGNCDGTGLCQYWASTTECRPASCVNGLLTQASTCPGEGASCPTGEEVSCGNYRCDGTSACKTACDTDADCLGGAYCRTDTHECVAKLSIGEDCGENAQCASGFCADGVCCETSCDGGCRSCNLPDSVGVCTFFGTGTDPDVDCESCQVCNGAGLCVAAANNTDPKDECAAGAGECGLSGFCNGASTCGYWGNDHNCGATSCAADVFTPFGKCDGEGNCAASQPEPCVAFKCNDGGTSCRTVCTTNDQCQTGFWCNSLGKCVSSMPNGTPCNPAVPAECDSGYCVNGFCCDGTCASTCKTCNQNWSTTGTIAIDGNLADWGSTKKLGTGSNAVGYYITFDADYIYLAWDGVNLSADKVFVAFDIDALKAGDSGVGGSSNAKGGAYFTGLRKPEYLVAFNKTVSGGVINLYAESATTPGTWDFAQNMSGWSNFPGYDSTHKVNELRIPKSALPGLSTTSGMGVWMWVNNAAETNVWSIWPNTNTAGAAPIAMANAQFFIAGQGMCQFVHNDSDPDFECGLCKVCNGSGACKFVANDVVDPKGQCTQSTPDTCATNGRCNGSGICSLWSPETVCIPISCVDDKTVTKVSFCTGAGDCTSNGTEECADGFKCKNGACLVMCTTNDDCQTGRYCDGTACQLSKDNGQTCSTSAECSSGNCVDGYCCDSACNGTCEACNVSGSAGTCTAHAASTDPDNDCIACLVCNGSGGCVNVPDGDDPVDDCQLSEAGTCGLNGVCNGTGTCSFWPATQVCAAASCGVASDGLHYEAKAQRSCSGAGACAAVTPSSCGAYRCSKVNGETHLCGTACTAATDCVAGFYCDATSKCVAKSAVGTACTTGDSCMSGYCTDGYCCDKSCNGPCVACNLAGKNGTCTALENGFDSKTAPECPICQVCNGTDGCRAVVAGLADPKQYCSIEDPCGFSGLCDGAGGCGKYGPETSCGTGASACRIESGIHTLYPKEHCDSAGAASTPSPPPVAVTSATSRAPTARPCALPTMTASTATSAPAPSASSRSPMARPAPSTSSTTASAPPASALTVTAATPAAKRTARPATSRTTWAPAPSPMLTPTPPTTAASARSAMVRVPA
jgi:subtilisin-like proprotein convertase family protein